MNAQPEVLGTTRRVQVGRNTLVERIIEFDPHAALAYDIVGLPRRMGALSNRWSLRPAGPGTEVTITSNVRGSGPPARLTDGVIARVLAKQSDAMLAGLARRVEDTHD